MQAARDQGSADEYSAPVTSFLRTGDEGLKIGRSTMQPYHDIIDEALETGEPFFVWYGVFLPHSPHSPHNAPDRLYDYYKTIAPNEATARYWANVEWFDETCKQLLDYLDEAQLAENTLVVYVCDKGWVPHPERRHRYLRSKREPVEAGIHTPIMIRHPGQLTAKHDKETLASAIDIAPTILRACGIEPPVAMSGLDLRDPSSLAQRNRVFVDVYQHDSDLSLLEDPNSGLVAKVVIDGWDKLIAWPDPNELFDLALDPDDLRDISAAEPERVKELAQTLDARWPRAK